MSNALQILTVLFCGLWGGVAGVGLFPTTAGATALGDFRRDIALYRDAVDELSREFDIDHAERDFLEIMKKEAEYLSAFARGKPPLPEEIAQRVETFSRVRSLAKRQEPLTTASPVNSAFDEESRYWELLVAPYLDGSFLRRLVLERALLSRREHDYDFAASANFLERPVNDNVGFLQYRDEERGYRQQGISRFEVNAGLEPFILVENDNPLGIMANIGLLYHLFPEVRQSEKNRFLAEELYSGWWDRQLTRHLRKVGFRVGAGALFDGPTPAFGVGIRLRSVTIWGLYSSGDTEYSLAIGFSDFEWLKKINLVAPF